MCTKKGLKHTPPETELPERLQIVEAGESPLEYQDPERGSRSLTIAVASGPDDAHVLKLPGDIIWPFTLQACAAVILVVSTAGTIDLAEARFHLRFPRTASPIFRIGYGPAQVFVSPTFPESLLGV
jgi:hypothetical protein